MTTELKTDTPLTIGTHTLARDFIVGTGKYATLRADARLPRRQRLRGDDRRRPPRAAGRQARAATSSTSSTSKRYTILPNTAGCFTAEDAIRARPAWRASCSTNLEQPRRRLGEARSAWATRRRCCPTRSARCEATEQLVEEGFQVLVLHERRPDHGPAAEGGRGGERDAGRQPDRQRPGRAQPEQHPHHPGVPEGRRPGLPGDRRRRRRHGQRRGDRDGAGLRRRAAQHRRSPTAAGPAADGPRDAARHARPAGSAYLAGRIPKKLYATASSPETGDHFAVAPLGCRSPSIFRWLLGLSFDVRAVDPVFFFLPIYWLSCVLLSPAPARSRRVSAPRGVRPRCPRRHRLPASSHDGSSAGSSAGRGRAVQARDEQFDELGSNAVPAYSRSSAIASLFAAGRAIRAIRLQRAETIGDGEDARTDGMSSPRRPAG